MTPHYIVVACLLTLSLIGNQLVFGLEGWVSGDPNRFTSAQVTLIVDKHNEYRRNETAGDMLKIAWDPKLADLAQKSADICRYGQTEAIDRGSQAGYSHVGENIFICAATGFFASDCVERWGREKRYYDFNSGKCAEGKKCNQFTQVIWAKTRAVGCGVNLCVRKLVNDQWMTFFVVICIYGPGGNTWHNNVLQKPYLPGPNCDKCPSDCQYCEDKLCIVDTRHTKDFKIIRHRQSQGDFDHFCEERMGQASFICMHPHLYNGSRLVGDILCKQVFCAKDGNPQLCVRHTDVPDGFVCGVGKICKSGKCTTDIKDDITRFNENCLFGEQWSVFSPVVAEVMPCLDMDEDICRGAAIWQQCCHTCGQYPGLGGEHRSMEAIARDKEVCVIRKLYSSGYKREGKLKSAAYIRSLTIREQVVESCTPRDKEYKKELFGFSEMKPAFFVNNGCKATFEVCYIPGECKLFELSPLRPDVQVTDTGAIQSMDCKRRHTTTECVKGENYSWSVNLASVKNGCDCDFLICYSAHERIEADLEYGDIDEHNDHNLHGHKWLN